MNREMRLFPPWNVRSVDHIVYTNTKSLERSDTRDTAGHTIKGSMDVGFTQGRI